MLLLWMMLGTAMAERPVTYREALEAALTHNVELRQAQVAVDSAGAGFISANSTFDPTLSVNGSWNPISQDVGLFNGVLPYTSNTESFSGSMSLSSTAPTGTTAQLNLNTMFTNSEYDIESFGDPQTVQFLRNTGSISLTQQLLKGLLMSYNLQTVRQARMARTGAELDLETTRQSILASTAESYWGLVYQQELLRIATEAVTVAEENLRIGRLRVDAGELAPVEATRLEAALVQAKKSLIDARYATAAAADGLAVLMGDAPGSELLAADDVGTVRQLDLDAEKVLEVALEQNLGLQGARMDVDQSRLDLSVSKHSLLPSLSLTGTVGYNLQQNSQDGEDVVYRDPFSSAFSESALPEVTLSAQFEMPLGNRSAIGDRKSASADLYNQELTLESTERSVRSDVLTELRNLETAQQAVALADANLRLAQQTLTAEEAKAEEGDVVLKDVLEARQELDNARAEAAKARIDLRTSQVKLLQLQGGLTIDAMN